jgi:mannose-1-phosphate guanylyltransferase
MEKAPNIYTIPSDFGWSDLGTWASLYSEYEKNEDANALFGDNILAIETKNCLIRIPKDKLLVVKGLEDFIVIDDDDVLLIWPKSEEQEIKKVTNTIEKLKGNKYL